MINKSMCSAGVIKQTSLHFSFQPVLHNRYNKGYVLSCLWDGAYKRFIVGNHRVAHEVAAVGILSYYLSDTL